jgi:excisionase family DNA binding protein
METWMVLADEGYITIAEATDLIHVSRSTLWRWIDEGRLPAYRLGRRRVLVRRDDLRSLIAPRLEPQAASTSELEALKARLNRPRTVEEQARALAALESARRFAAEMRERHGGALFSDSAEIIREMREDRSREL